MGGTDASDLHHIVRGERVVVLTRRGEGMLLSCALCTACVSHGLQHKLNTHRPARCTSCVTQPLPPTGTAKQATVATGVFFFPIEAVCLTNLTELTNTQPTNAHSIMNIIHIEINIFYSAPGVY